MRKRDEIERKIHKLRQDKACVPTTGRTIRDIIDSAYIAGCIDCLKWALQKPGDPDNCVPPEDEVPEKEIKVEMREQVVVEDDTPTSAKTPPDPVAPPAPPALRVVQNDDEKEE